MSDTTARYVIQSFTLFTIAFLVYLAFALSQRGPLGLMPQREFLRYCQEDEVLAFVPWDHENVRCVHIDGLGRAR